MWVCCMLKGEMHPCRNQPFVEQAGSPGLFPSTTNPAFNLGPGTSHYLVIGGDSHLLSMQISDFCMRWQSTGCIAGSSSKNSFEATSSGP